MRSGNCTHKLYIEMKKGCISVTRDGGIISNHLGFVRRDYTQPVVVYPRNADLAQVDGRPALVFRSDSVGQGWQRQVQFSSDAGISVGTPAASFAP